MKKSLLSFSSICFVFITLLLESCSTHAKEEILFNPHIAAFTSGVVSNQTTVRILFNEPVSGISAGSPAEKNLLKVSPSVDGQALWLDNQTLVYKTGEILEHKYPINRLCNDSIIEHI